MTDRLISGDNHIDLTYCPPDLWSSQAPAKWKLLVPRVEELEDGCHWFVDAVDRPGEPDGPAQHSAVHAVGRTRTVAHAPRAVVGGAQPGSAGGNRIR